MKTLQKIPRHLSGVTTKAISYAYVTSPNAVAFGYGKTGCYIVETIRGYNPPKAFAAFATKKEAVDFANEAMPQAWHPRYANNAL